MVAAASRGYIKRVPGDLFAVHRQVVAPGNLRADAQQAAGLHDNRKLPRDIKIPLAKDKGKIEVAQVVVDRAAARQPARKAPAIGLQRFHIAFLPAFLVAADHHGVPVLPQVQDTFPGTDGLHQHILPGKVFVRVGARRAHP